LRDLELCSEGSSFSACSLDLLHALVVGVVRHVEVDDAFLDGGNGIIVVGGGGVDVAMGACGALPRGEMELVGFFEVELELLPHLVGLGETTPLEKGRFIEAR
jgi:hypothetical protein